MCQDLAITVRTVWQCRQKVFLSATGGGTLEGTQAANAGTSCLFDTTVIRRWGDRERKDDPMMGVIGDTGSCQCRSGVTCYRQSKSQTKQGWVMPDHLPCPESPLAKVETRSQHLIPAYRRRVKVSWCGSCRQS